MTQRRGRGSATSQPSDVAADGDTGHVSDEFEALQHLVATRHHVLLGPDDPIALLHTVNELLVAQTAKKLEQAQHAVLTKFCHELELSVAAWKREAKEVGERTLEAARRVSTEQITESQQELIDALARERTRTTAAMRRATLLNTIVLLATALSILGFRWLH